MPVRKSLVFGLLSLASWLGAAAVGYHYWQNLNASQLAAPPQTAVVVQAPTDAPGTPSTVNPTSTPTPSPTPLPQSLSIQGVPFTIQAPFQVWDKTHEEYCEAANIYMVGQYWSGDHRARIPPAEADASMGRMVAWERASFPTDINLSLAEMVQVGAHFYGAGGVTGQVVPVDFAVIQQQLAAGRPVIIPVLTHGGPAGSRIYPTYGAQNVYHVITLIGYDAAKGLVYTNDPGLREGQGLAYAWSILQTAITSAANTRVDGSGIPVPYQQGTAMLIFQKP
jgi:hypothetical protein